MQQAHADLFAGAAFTLDQNGDIGLGYSLQLISNRLHSGCLAKKDLEWREIECGGGFDVVIQGHFFLSALGKNRKFAIRFTYARQAPFPERRRSKKRISRA
jgi:hypothetical protein